MAELAKEVEVVEAHAAEAASGMPAPEVKRMDFVLPMIHFTLEMMDFTKNDGFYATNDGLYTKEYGFYTKQ